MSEAQIKAEYNRREPERDLIYKTIKNHWPEFLSLAESPSQNKFLVSGRDPPMSSSFLSNNQINADFDQRPDSW